MYVIKRDGRLEKFDMMKIIHTCSRSGVPEDVARNIAKEVQNEIYNRIPSEEVYKIVLEKLKKFQRSNAYLYKLRDAVSYIEPTAFEKFTKRILDSMGYKSIWNMIIQGKCIDHQVDVVAEKESKKYLVECKRHTNPHRFCGLGVGLQVQARLEDILDGYKRGMNKYNFYRAWIFTNTKFSEHIIKYASAKNILLTGWRYPQGNGLENLIQKSHLLPITLLPISKSLKITLQINNIITLKDFISSKRRTLERLGISDNRINSLKKLSQDMLNKI